MQRFSMQVWMRRAPQLLVATATLIAAACGGGGGGDGGSSSPSAHGASGSPNAAGNNAPVLTGSPITSVAVGTAYSFQPTATDREGDTLAFAIENRPAWAVFNTSTGKLSGTPKAADVGTTQNIVISVSDGKARTALSSFSITVATAAPPAAGGTSVTLSWDVPTQAVTGDNVADLAGYRIHYGTNAEVLANAVEVASPGMNNYTVANLKPGTYYFAVCALRADGVQSAPSNIIKRVIS